ncbi:transposase [Roseofilum sp. BLCC_M154]|uniref:Transposase n=1 Tax=Roseofilum acuticapitatum BLCC-M154 TaxID=3022444 RepID=A0ABT7APK4_9CYAN|nr:transposase [Roseofilum acuticapitatum]MDJ1168825.1 transposase [Roseofilum acuticapitatum BLCC-M154]
MKYNPKIHHRRSIRLPEYDYSQPGFYFVTICIYQRECLLGKIEDGMMKFSRYGQVVEDNWFNLTKIYSHIALNIFVIMPNHFHGIIEIKEQDKKHDLAKIIRTFKTFSARRINQIRSMKGIPVWQRGYYEHIIRDEGSLATIQQYIMDNPLKWETDELYPSHDINQSVGAGFSTILESHQ